MRGFLEVLSKAACRQAPFPGTCTAAPSAGRPWTTAREEQALCKAGRGQINSAPALQGQCLCDVCCWAETAAEPAAELCQGPSMRFDELVGFDVPNSLLLLPVFRFYLSGELEILCQAQSRREGPARPISGIGKIWPDGNSLLATAGLLALPRFLG